MKRRNLILYSLAAAATAQSKEPAKPAPTSEAFQEHLDIWMFEISLNSRIPKKSFFEINPHTERIIQTHAHLFPKQTREALSKDISLLLPLKENDAIVAFARKQGVEIYRGSFGKEEHEVWIKLLDDFADGNKNPASAPSRAASPKAPEKP